MSSKPDAKSGATLKVTLLRRPIDQKQRNVVEGMGLRRIRHSVEIADTPASRGMVHKVRHLVAVEPGRPSA